MVRPYWRIKSSHLVPSGASKTHSLIQSWNYSVLGLRRYRNVKIYACICWSYERWYHIQRTRCGRLLKENLMFFIYFTHFKWIKCVVQTVSMSDWSLSAFPLISTKIKQNKQFATSWSSFLPLKSLDIFFTIQNFTEANHFTNELLKCKSLHLSSKQRLNTSSDQLDRAIWRRSWSDYGPISV